jgi:hypothetical protein
MKIHQLSVFLENKPGQLVAPCKVLAEHDINIATLSLADTEQFGILRLIVKDWENTKRLLEDAGCVVKVTEVLAIEVPDKPGGLSDVLQTVDSVGVNVEYMYAFSEKLNDRAVLVFRFDDPDKAVDALADSHVNVISNVELYERLGAN